LNDPPKNIDIKVEDDRLFVRNKQVHSKYIGSNISFASDEGWVDTRDSVMVSGNRINFCGRSDGVINVGGDKVYPEEVERVLLSHPLVASARVYAKSNAIIGELVIADVVLTEEVTNKKKICEVLQSFALQTLERHKVPALIKIVPMISLNSVGKIIRK